MEFPITISASKKYAYNLGIRIIETNDNEIYSVGLNSINEDRIFPFLLFSFRNENKYFFTTEFSLKQKPYPIRDYFNEEALFWDSFSPQKFSNSIPDRTVKINFDWQNKIYENRINAEIHYSKKYWKYFWSENSFYIDKEEKKRYVANLSYSLKKESNIFSVKYRFENDTDFKKEAEFSFIKKRLAEVLKLLPEPSGQNEPKKLDSMSPD